MAKQEIAVANIPSVTVDESIDLLSQMYSSAILNKTPMKTIPSVMLWGPPGVGKSQGVQQIAKKIERTTGKPVSVTDVRLLLFNPIDLRGIPTSNADKTLAIWLKPQIFQMDESDKVINILFLDEISAAPQSVQAAAYQITLDRVVGEHKLPENCIVIAAGNRITDKSVAFKMPKALANRLLHLDIKGNFESWRKWAVTNGINEKVLGFLSFKQDSLMGATPADEELAFATPRSWEMVSNVLNNVYSDIENMFPLISGLVGVGHATEFRSWSYVFDELPVISEILEGKMPNAPTSTDALYALVSSMSVYAQSHKDDLEGIAHSIDFAETLPSDFGAVLMKDYLCIEEGYKEKLIGIPSFARWLSEKGKLLNGFI